MEADGRRDRLYYKPDRVTRVSIDLAVSLGSATAEGEPTSLSDPLSRHPKLRSPA
jgi:hypothetical protein